MPSNSQPTLIPAYERDYTTASAAIDDYKNGLDFIDVTITSQLRGKYCSCRDFANVRVKLRYNNKRDVTFVTHYVSNNS